MSDATARRRGRRRCRTGGALRWGSARRGSGSRVARSRTPGGAAIVRRPRATALARMRNAFNRMGQHLGRQAQQLHRPASSREPARRCAVPLARSGRSEPRSTVGDWQEPVDARHATTWRPCDDAASADGGLRRRLALRCVNCVQRGRYIASGSRRPLAGTREPVARNCNREARSAFSSDQWAAPAFNELIYKAFGTVCNEPCRVAIRSKSLQSAGPVTGSAFHMDHWGRHAKGWL